ncbi:U exon [Squirrel monkey adenovirus]|nr:U exon [Squirrel monkey adenovirus]
MRPPTAMHVWCGASLTTTHLPFSLWRKFATRRGLGFQSWEEGRLVEVLNTVDLGELMSDFR